VGHFVPKSHGDLGVWEERDIWIQQEELFLSWRWRKQALRYRNLKVVATFNTVKDFSVKVALYPLPYYICTGSHNSVCCLWISSLFLFISGLGG